jgi:hypothetical protein
MMIRTAKLLLAISLFLWDTADVIGESGSVASRIECPIEYKSHNLLNGIGVYAGKSYKKGEVIDRCIGFSIEDSVSMGSVICNYTFVGASVNQSVLVGGDCLIFNHHSTDFNVAIYDTATVHVVDDNLTLEVYYRYKAVTTRRISIGEELLFSYGSEYNFDETTGSYVSSLGDAKNGGDAFPGCRHKLTEIIERRVYATQRLVRGDVIEVSRALFLPGPPDHRFDSVKPYVWFHDFRDDGMFLSGNGPFYRGKSSDFNAVYQWYSSERNNGSAFYWEDFVATRIALVSFVVIKDIEVNEEITIPLLIEPREGNWKVLSGQLLPHRHAL